MMLRDFVATAHVRFSKSKNMSYGGVHKRACVLKCMVYFMENTNLKWIWFGGGPILGNLHMAANRKKLRNPRLQNRCWSKPLISAKKNARSCASASAAIKGSIEEVSWMRIIKLWIWRYNLLFNQDVLYLDTLHSTVKLKIWIFIYVHTNMHCLYNSCNVMQSNVM